MKKRAKKVWYEVQARFYDKQYKTWKRWVTDDSAIDKKSAKAHQARYVHMVEGMGYKIGLDIVTRIVRCEVVQ